MHEPVFFAARPLSRVLTRARRAPFYATRLAEAGTVEPKTYQDWCGVPLTEKSDLRRAYPLGMLAVPFSDVASYHESSGTSGEPTPSFFTEGDWNDIAQRFVRNAVRLGPGDLVLVKTPYSLVTTAHQMQRAARLAGAAVVPADNRSAMMPYAKVVRLLRDLPITVAWCLPTEALIWAEAAIAAGLDPATDFSYLRAFLVAGEVLSDAKRRRISELWGGKRVYQDYGSTETGSLGGECAAGSLHLWADRLFFEMRDDAGATTGLAPGLSGELVVTPFERDAMPLVRYRLGDVVRVAAGQCACGSALPVVEVIGRAATAGSLVPSAHSTRAIEDVVYSLPRNYGVVFWRATFVSSSSLAVEIAAARGSEDVAADELAHGLFSRLGLKATVTSVPLEKLVPIDVLREVGAFQKPRFVFAAGEDWRRGLNYW